MKNKILSVLFFTLLITAIIPVVSSLDYRNTSTIYESNIIQSCLLDNWTQQQKLLASDGSWGDLLGCSVSLDGDTALVGACGFQEDSNGSAYIFTRSSNSWTEQQKLVPSDEDYFVYFGYAVALDGDTCVIGAPGEQFSPAYPGAAFVFTRAGTTWAQQARLVASDGGDGDYFGSSVSISGDTVIIGRENWDNDLSSAYVFTRSGTTWTEQAKLFPLDGTLNDWFGVSVFIDDNTALIGNPFDDDNGAGSGSAYVFTRSGNTWTQQAKLLALDGAMYDQFGQSVSLDGDNAIIGAYYDSENGEESGSAYIFTRNGITWTQQAKLLPSDGDADDWFGWSVSIFDDTALIGAYQDDDTVYNSGSAYIFTRTGVTWSQLAKLQASDYVYGRNLGDSVSLDGDNALIGASGDNESGGPGGASGAAYVFIKEIINYPPNPPTITGSVKGKTGTEYGYTLVTTDPEGQQIHYFIDWADATNSSWVGPYSSGVEMTKLHTWHKKGTYTIQAKAKDASGAESEWGTFEVTMPRNRAIDNSLLRFFEEHPVLYKIFQLFFMKQSKYFLEGG